MPRFGIAINESSDQRFRAPKPDQYGRRVRDVQGVRVAGVREEPTIFSSLFFKVTLTLSIVAMLAVSLAAWRLFTFRH